jgi:D-arabinose 1-dehydrogenase-like Zn-dependent alcohol dehydrogenase|tara:strand:- start:413 stop:595 length:183 start_codon:yes stop_codon:yes gene_type:complete
MKVGNLVKRRDDHIHHGIVVEVGPQETAIDHGNNVSKVQWNDGDLTCEFTRLLEVISEIG